MKDYLALLPLLMADAKFGERNLNLNLATTLLVIKPAPVNYTTLSKIIPLPGIEPGPPG